MKKSGGGRRFVLTAEEIIDYAAAKGARKARQEVDVVTTGTFGPMCSSGAYFNVGHTKLASNWGEERFLSTMFRLCGFSRRRLLSWGDGHAGGMIPETKFFRANSLMEEGM